MFRPIAASRRGRGSLCVDHAPHSFYWFAIEPEVPGTPDLATTLTAQLEKIELPAGWKSLATGRTKKAFAAIDVRSLPQRPWFDAKGRTIQAVQVFE